MNDVTLVVEDGDVNATYLLVGVPNLLHKQVRWGTCLIAYLSVFLEEGGILYPSRLDNGDDVVSKAHSLDYLCKEVRRLGATNGGWEQALNRLGRSLNQS